MSSANADRLRYGDVLNVTVSSNDQKPELFDELDKLASLQRDLEAAGILPAPPRTITQQLAPILLIAASTLVGSGLGLFTILVGWLTYRLIF